MLKSFILASNGMTSLNFKEKMHTGQRPDICSSANFLPFYRNVDFRVSLILLHKEKVISSMKKAENCRFKPVIIIKMFSSTAI